MNENRQNTADSAQKDLSSAVKMGANTARTAKTVSSAAAKAAAGNAAGAAVTLAKDPETVKKIISVALVIVLIFGVLIVGFLYALPTAIYETSNSYFSGVAEEWRQETYAGGNDAFWSGIWSTIKLGGTILRDAVAGTIDHLFGGVLSGSNSPANKKANGTAIETPDEMEMKVTQEEAAETQTLKKKMTACVDKVQARSDAIKSKLNASSGTISSVVRNYYCASGRYEPEHFTVNVNIQSDALSDSAAIEILSLYTVQAGGSLDNVRLSDLMRWLGWYNSLKSGTVNCKVLGGAVNVRVPAWDGLFLPQYLYEQRRQEIFKFGEAVTDFESYQCPAVDLLLVVDSPNLGEIYISETPVHEFVGTVTDPDTGETTDVYDDYILAVADVNISIRPRNVSAVADIAGLWKGDWNDDQTRTSGDRSSGLTFGSDGQFVWPLPGYSPGSAYGWRLHPIYGVMRHHDGEDIGAPSGTPILAADAGKVITANWSGGYGNFVAIDHGNGYVTRYAHLISYNVSVGDRVNAGDVIGFVGSTGDSTGPHLHFEVRLDGQFTDPKNYTYKSVVS